MRDIEAHETSLRARRDSNGEVLQGRGGLTLSVGYAGILELRVEGSVVQDAAANRGSRVGNSKSDGEPNLNQVACYALHRI